MLLLEGTIKIDKKLSIQVYLQIANTILAYIRQGKLKPGTALPGSRSLAVKLNIHRQTVIAAYDELHAQGWTEVYPRKGVYVAKNLPDLAARPFRKVISEINTPAETFFKVDHNKIPFPDSYKGNPAKNLVFNDGFPDTRIAPLELLLREYRRFANYKFTPKYLMYGPEQGSENLRSEMAKFLFETRGLRVSANEILITRGVQMALYLAAHVLIDKNDTVIAADPGYFGANEVFEQAGAKLELVPVDEHGMDLDAVEAICKKMKVRLLYVIPHHHRPTTVTLSADRRMRLLELAMQYNFAILEDDYDYDFRYTNNPILPLASEDYYGSVIYVGSFCKTIAPGIRLGFMVSQDNLIKQASRLRKLIDRQGDQLMEEAMANLLKNGDISRHLKKANKIYHERRDMLCQLLTAQIGDHVSFKVPDGGFGIWMKYLNGIQPQDVAQMAAAMGLTMSNGNNYYYCKDFKSAHIRIGFASLNNNELEEAVGKLHKAITKLI